MKGASMVDFSLEDKVALVTGGSRGIGEEIALALAEHGAHCVLCSRKLDGLNRVKDLIEARGGRASALVCNQGDMGQIRALFSDIRERFGRLDILINNAATNPFFGEMVNAEEWAWDKTLSVNLKGPFFMIQQAARLMIEAGRGGAILNVASINGLSPGPLQGIYSITKAGLICMTKAYAKELAGAKIRVNALLPGITATDFSKALLENEITYNWAMQLTPMKRPGQPSEMAGAALYLVSNASSYTTGAVIVCDGGMTA
jgi:NAD(P)-dependent dehydrogenase (short-subunit alcohol dehydrogenase family)